MKLIKPSFSILDDTNYNIESIYKRIELVGRCSHKSEDRITEDSAKEFVDRMIKMNHLATCEFGTVYLQFFWPGAVCQHCNQTMPHKLLDRYGDNKYSIVKYHGNDVYVTTNMRVLIENNWLDDLKYLCEPTEYHEKRTCVRFICDRAISHEFVRHRKFSFLQESTRYVDSSSMKPIIEYNCNDIADICAAYQQGFSMKNIADNSSLTERGIHKILLENNIVIRGLNNKGNRVEDYFSIIDTPEKAYLLGIIQTDGSVRITNKNAALTITQHKDYAWYIEDMLLNFSDKVCNTKDRNCRQLQIGSKTIVNDLINLGIVPNKTKVQTDDNINTFWSSIPEEFKGDFIRGCIDGDGYVTFFTQKSAKNESCNIGFCSIKEILIDKIIEFINTKFNYRCGKNKDGDVYKLYITDREKAIKIGTYLYTNFKYPFGHPKKASTWINRINKSYPISNYKDSKFQIIQPCWLDNSSPEAIYSFVKVISSCEDSYTKLRISGWKAEEARSVLPLALKTELYMCGFAEDWKKFFELRTASNAHPQARELAIPLRDEFIKRHLID